MSASLFTSSSSILLIARCSVSFSFMDVACRRTWGCGWPPRWACLRRVHQFAACCGVSYSSGSCARGSGPLSCARSLCLKRSLSGAPGRRSSGLACDCTAGRGSGRSTDVCCLENSCACPLLEVVITIACVLPSGCVAPRMWFCPKVAHCGCCP